MVSTFSSWMMAKCRNLRGREGKPRRAGECAARGPGRRGPRGIAQGRGFWRPRPRCFPRGYYELSVPGRRPGTFRAPPLRRRAPARPPRPLAGPERPVLPLPAAWRLPAGQKLPPPLCKRGLRVPAAAPPPAEGTRTGGGGGCVCAAARQSCWTTAPGTRPDPRFPGPRAQPCTFARPPGRCTDPGPPPQRRPRASGCRPGASARPRHPGPRHLRVSVLGELLLPRLGAARRLLRLEADLPQLFHHLLVLLVLHGVQAAVVAVVQQPLLLERVPGALHGPLLAGLRGLEHGAVRARALLPRCAGQGLRGALAARGVADRRDSGFGLLWALQRRRGAL